jgi:hypothetical protein
VVRRRLVQIRSRVEAAVAADELKGDLRQCARAPFC